MNENTFTCSECGRTLPIRHNGGTGYGVDRETGARYCYTCAGVSDYADLTDPTVTRFVAYLSIVAGGWRFTNWPGSLRADMRYVDTGAHNIARVRHDFDVVAYDRTGAPHYWHGTQYGEWLEIAHMTRRKHAPRYGRPARVRVVEA